MNIILLLYKMSNKCQFVIDAWQLYVVVSLVNDLIQAHKTRELIIKTCS